MTRLAAIAGILALAAAGCIVTDDIDFSEDVNHPPQVTAVSPDNTEVQTVCRGDTPTFQVSLWDPDEEDAPPETEAEIRVWLVDYPTEDGQVGGECTVSATSPAADSAFQGGVLLHASCTLLVLKDPFSSIAEGDVLMTRVLVSDRPFVQGAQTARTAAAVWTLEVLPDSECPNQVE